MDIIIFVQCTLYAGGPFLSEMGKYEEHEYKFDCPFFWHFLPLAWPIIIIYAA